MARILDPADAGSGLAHLVMCYFVYILESKKTGSYYFGQTKDLKKRIERHNSGRNKSTKAGIPWEIKWEKKFETRSEAFKEETKLKGIKKRKGVEDYVIKSNYRGVAQSG